MTSDLIMIFATIALLAACVQGIKTKYQVLAVVVLALSVLPILFFIVINIPVIISPLTAELHGKVIDAETKKPLAGINVKAGWYASTVSVGGGYGEYYKLFKTKTDNNGEFVLPRGLKALNVYGPLGIRKFDEVNVIIYPSGYDYKVERTHYTNENKHTIALEKVKTDKEFLDNILNYYHRLFLMHKGSGDEISDPDEKKWLKNAYYQFKKTYPQHSYEDQQYLQKITNILEAIKEPDCVYILQKILVKYPNNASLTWYAKNNLDALKKIYNVK